MWIFGYGSLIYNPNVPYDACQLGYVEGWGRRFFQGSRDHRGVEGAPGRVVTLVESARERTYGMAFHVPSYERERVLATLDVREQGGYERHHLILQASDGRALPVLTYLGSTSSRDYLGRATPREIATQIFYSTGPSGTNSAYLLDLAAALRALRVECAHTFAIERHLLALLRAVGAAPEAPPTPSLV